MSGQFITQSTMEGVPVQTGEWSLAPVSRALVVRLPGNMGGFTWNRPAGVRVIRPGQADQILAVADPTRWVILSLFAGMFVLSLGMLLRGENDKPVRLLAIGDENG